jgi:ABC-type branched-subunit amino acid transport system ATPase component
VSDFLQADSAREPAGRRLTGGAQKVIDSRIAEVYELLPRLQERRTQQGGTLSRGEQHRQQTTSPNR